MAPVAHLLAIVDRPKEIVVPKVAHRWDVKVIVGLTAHLMEIVGPKVIVDLNHVVPMARLLAIVGVPKEIVGLKVAPSHPVPLVVIAISH